MKIIVCGSSGLLGRELMKQFNDNNIDCIGTYNNNYVPNSIKINFNDINDIKTNFIKNNLTICINSIVERQLEICEGNWDTTKKINIDITNNIAKVCKELNIYLIHISTDYVFDGQKAPYYPDNETNPLQNYGISKLISEKKVIANSDKYSIIRVPVLYYDNIKNFEENAVTLIGKKILNRIEIQKEDNFSIRRPNYIPDFCEFIIDIVKNPIYGILHYCNPYDKVTKYEMSNIISNYLEKKNNIISINEEPKDGAERPKDTLLKDNKFDIMKYKFTPIKIGLEKCFSKIYHPKLNINNDINTSEIFFMIDLDGTLIESDYCHYEGYKKSLEKYNINLEYEDFLNIINNKGIDKYLDNFFTNDEKSIIKNNKNLFLKNINSINLIKNANIFIDYIHKYNINHVVVTNTSLENILLFKEKVPELNKLKNWITREEYNNPKPSSECYELGKKKFYNNEKYIIGIENSISGYKSLQNITKSIYIITDINDIQYKYFKKEDVYLINNYLSIFE
jgi:dTDP-4-dehydrorhamnose reductase